MRLSRSTLDADDVELTLFAARMAALAHPVRLGILRHLAMADACCCKDIVERVDLAQSTVSQHLKVLVEAGLVRYRPERPRSRYSIDREAVAGLADATASFLGLCCAGADHCGQPHR